MHIKLSSLGGLRMVSLLGLTLVYAGFCLLLLVAGTYAYGRFEAWSERQPRALSSSRMIWLQVPPMTPLPAPVVVALPTATPTPAPPPDPPVLIEIERFGIKRAVVPVSHKSRKGRLEWDADQLFATRSRKDLVGHLEGTASPGQPGNIVLIGHNYNRGAYNWEGAFHSIHRLEKGDVIVLVNARDESFSYEVERVEKVPLSKTLQHIVHLAPTRDETLTLATCGGANFAPFPARVYVTAKRVESEG